MELIAELNLEQLIIKAPPKKTGISEIYYKKDDGSIIKPIFQTPRLKIIYGAKKFKDKSTYSYCVTLHNADIDEEVECFYNLVSLIDEHILTQIKIQTTQSYKSSLYRKTKESDYSMRLRLIDDATLIKNSKGKLCQPTDIQYGDYADQYIGLDCLIYNEDTIIPIWNVHQVVLTPLEKIFLGVCLLDTIYGSDIKQEQHAIPDIPTPPALSPATTFTIGSSNIIEKKYSSPLSMISLNDILQVKLKKHV
jgi:hypothetical protein